PRRLRSRPWSPPKGRRRTRHRRSRSGRPSLHQSHTPPAHPTPPREPHTRSHSKTRGRARKAGPWAGVATRAHTGTRRRSKPGCRRRDGQGVSRGVVGGEGAREPPCSLRAFAPPRRLAATARGRALAHGRGDVVLFELISGSRGPSLMTCGSSCAPGPLRLARSSRSAPPPGRGGCCPIAGTHGAGSWAPGGAAGARGAGGDASSPPEPAWPVSRGARAPPRHGVEGAAARYRGRRARGAGRPGGRLGRGGRVPTPRPRGDRRGPSPAGKPDGGGGRGPGHLRPRLRDLGAAP